MKRYFLPLFLIVIVLAIVDAPLESVRDGVRTEQEQNDTSDDDHEQESSEESDSEENIFIGPLPIGRTPVLIEIMILAYWLLFVPIIEYGADLLFVQAARREHINVKNIIIGFNDYVTIVLANLLVGALVGIGLIALIIPGIIIGCRLAFVSYLVMDKGLDPIAAVEGSWKLTRGHGWRIFGLGVTSIFIFIGGLLLMIVGTIPAVIWIKSAFASLYQAAVDETDETLYLPPQVS